MTQKEEIPLRLVFASIGTILMLVLGGGLINYFLSQSASDAIERWETIKNDAWVIQIQTHLFKKELASEAVRSARPDCSTQDQRNRFLPQSRYPSSPVWCKVALGGEGPVDAVKLTTNEGYSGEITLSLAFDKRLEIVYLKVLAHDETGGFGANLFDAENGWLSDLVGNSLKDFAAESHGRRIDGLSGATISARAIINALRDILQAQQDMKSTGT